MKSTDQAFNHLFHKLEDAITITMHDIVDNEDAPETRIEAIIKLHTFKIQTMNKMHSIIFPRDR